MSPSLQRRLRLARRGLWYVLVVGLVLMALVAGVVSQLLPLAERHPQAIATWLGDRIGREVAFDRMQTSWTRRGPLLQLDGLRLGEGDDAIRVGDAEMLVSQYAGLLPGRSFTELRVRGLDQNVTLLNDDIFLTGLELYTQGEGNVRETDSLEGIPSELLGDL